MAKTYGHTEPRIFTPPLRELTPDTTLGFDVIDFSADVLGYSLHPWQRWLYVHALEIEGDFGGEWRFRFRTVVVEVARQQGKTFLGTILALFFLYMLGVALILGTAQDLEQAEDTWASVVDMAQADPDLAADIIRNGILLTGGGALLKMLDVLLTQELEVPVYVSDTAFSNVVEGCSRALENPDALRRSYTQK